ncbi:MAG: hypothetical protein ACK559_22580, partial [bacterium]
LQNPEGGQSGDSFCGQAEAPPRHRSGGSSLTPRQRSASEGQAEGRGRPPRLRPRTAGRGLGGLCNVRRFNV